MNIKRNKQLGDAINMLETPKHKSDFFITLNSRLDAIDIKPNTSSRIMTTGFANLAKGRSIAIFTAFAALLTSIISIPILNNQFASKMTTTTQATATSTTIGEHNPPLAVTLASISHEFNESLRSSTSMKGNYSSKEFSNNEATETRGSFLISNDGRRGITRQEMNGGTWQDLPYEPWHNWRFFQAIDNATALLRNDGYGQNSEVASIDNNGKTAWKLVFTIPEHDSIEFFCNRVEIVVDSELAFPISVSEFHDAKQLSAISLTNIELNKPVQPNPAEFKGQLPSVGELYAFQKANYEFMNISLPEGFTLQRTSFEKEISSPMNEYRLDTVTRIYTRGLERVEVITTRDTACNNGKPCDIYTPGGSTGHNPTKTVRLTSGLFATKDATISRGYWFTPHLHTATLPVDVYIVGDLSDDEMIAAANSLRH